MTTGDSHNGSDSQHRLSDQLSANTQQQILTRWEIAYHERTIGKILRRLGFRHLSAGPRHLGQEPAEIEAFKKTSPAGSARSPTSSRRRRR